ncbi:atrial natriuretic peptide receptor 1-like [Paramacrobiotus metropolitanus]|uniref:atrial natriuretic peptide receptor 1-like n=1 Tax=Paramacrobiotus metropolitanus TaxID=2943436 RepID=UPI002445E35D|nr:atrial natriuretic peptide receptor 1-like [Paramacrobiotus metropolitanus]
MHNYTFYPHQMSAESVCSDDARGVSTIEVGLADIYSNGVLELDGPTGPTMVVAAACPSVFQSLANFARELDVLAMSYTTQDAGFNDKTRFPTWLAFGIGDIFGIGAKVLDLMDRFGWRSIAVIEDRVSSFLRIGYSRRIEQHCKGVKELLKKRTDINSRIDIMVDSRPANVTTANGSDWATTALLEAANFSRIILTCTLGLSQREIALAASDLGMTNGDYVFMHLYEIEVANENPLSCKNPDGSYDVKLCDAFASYFMIRTSPVDWEKLKPFTSSAEAYAKRKYGSKLKNLEIAGAEMMTVLFEALETVVQTLDRERLLSNGSEVPAFSAHRTAAQTFGQTYNLTSRQMRMSPNGTRVVSVHIQVFNQSTNEFQTLFLADTASRGLTRVVFGKEDLPWEPGEVPLDRPLCGIHNEKCYDREQARRLTAIVLGVFVPLMCLIAAGVLLERWHRQAHAYKQWLIGPSALVRSAYMSTTASALSFKLGGKRLMEVHGVKVICCTPETEDSCDLIGGVMCADPSVFLKGHHRMKVTLKKTQLSKVLSQISTVQHANVNRFHGIFLHANPPFLCQQYCERGSLNDLMALKGGIDWDLKLSLISDLIEGLYAIHHSPIKFHGHLRPTKCVIDQRFCLKIDDLGHEAILGFLGALRPTASATPFTAPELLLYHSAGAPSDLFAFGALVAFIVTEQPLSRTLTTIYFDGTETKQSNVTHIRKRPSFYVHYEHPGCQDLEKLIEKCWDEDPAARPSASYVRARLRKITGSRNLLESLLERLRNHTENLEVSVYNRKVELVNEQMRCDALLNEMLPREVVRKLRAGQEVIPEAFEAVSIFFSYMRGFNEFAATSAPLEIVNFLDILYSRFDDSLSRFRVCKIEATGDNYLVASGLPVRNGSEHIREICDLSAELMSVFDNNVGGRKIELQAGVHSGPVEAGIIGHKRPRYCLFGDTMNTASRMASHGEPRRIHLSAEAAGLADTFGFQLEDRGFIYVKGKGDTRTFWLNPSC